MRWPLVIAFTSVAFGTASLLAYGCSTSPTPAEGTIGGSGPQGVPQPCSPEGATRACHTTITQQGNVLTCFEGTQTCRNGVWGVCGGDGTISTHNMHLAPTTSAPVGKHTTLIDVPEAWTVLVEARKHLPLERPALRATFEQIDPSTFEPTFALERAPSHRARVRLPAAASGTVRVEAMDSDVVVQFRLLGATDATIKTSDGMAVYGGGYPGADVIHRATPDGTEDLFVFAKKPDAEEIAYDVDVSKAAGLRLVESTLELLDAAGAPRLRVAPPFAVDASGKRFAAKLAVDGCRYDTSTKAPWNRPPTEPGASHCTLRVGWASPSLKYPVLVDPAWTATGSMATAREFHTLSPLSTGLLLAAGGDSGSPTATAELYNPTTGTWATTGSMSVARRRHIAASLFNNTAVMVAGGTDGTTTFSSAEVYIAATGVWGPSPYAQSPDGGPPIASAMTTARRRHAAVTLDSGNILITGGLNASGNALASAEIYNPYSDTFTATGAMLSPRSEHAMTLLTSALVLVTGGTNGTTALNTASTFNEGAGTFTATAGTMTAGRLGHSAVRLPLGKVLLAGGSNGTSVVSSAEIYDPVANTFAASSAMSTPRQYAASVLLSNGQALMAGGTNGSAAQSSAESFDPNAATWSSLSTMTAARIGATPAALPNTKVLVAGGYTGSSYLTTAELLGVEPGGDCIANADCISGVCNHNVCCQGACGGACLTCQQGSGACVAITNAFDITCADGGTTNWCNATGQCTALDPNCTNNPCDPTCRALINDGGSVQAAEAGLIDGGTTTVTWYGVVFGSGGAVNPNFAKTGLNDCAFNGTACGTYQYGKWAACQYDTYCNSPSTSTCSANGTDAGNCLQYAGGQTVPVADGGCPGANLTAGIGCTPPDASTFDIPICNRGNTTLASGTTVSLYFTSGNSYKYPSGPQCATATYGTSCAFKLSSPLAPGFCTDLTPNTPGASSATGYGQCGTTFVKQGTQQMFVNGDLSVNECYLPNSPYDGGGHVGCDDNWSDLHQQITCSVLSAVTGYGSATFTQQYAGSCPAGTHVQWSKFAYNASVPSNGSGSSSVTFQVQTAPLLTDGGIGAFGPTVDGGALVVAKPPTLNAPSGCGATCNCPMSGDGGPCPIDLYNALGGAPYARNEVLNLTITLNPTPDQQLAPTVTGWQITYSCPPSE